MFDPVYVTTLCREACTEILGRWHHQVTGRLSVERLEVYAERSRVAGVSVLTMGPPEHLEHTGGVFTLIPFACGRECLSRYAGDASGDCIVKSACRSAI